MQRYQYNDSCVDLRSKKLLRGSRCWRGTRIEINLLQTIIDVDAWRWLLVVIGFWDLSTMLLVLVIFWEIAWTSPEGFLHSASSTPISKILITWSLYIFKYTSISSTIFHSYPPPRFPSFCWIISLSSLSMCILSIF